MANYSFLQEINSTLTPRSWELNCFALLNSSDYDWSSGLVGSNGQPVSVLTSAAWGIDFYTCHKYCNATAIPFSMDFNFQTFASSLTNYFLPWLALTAQLPFETGNPWSNMISFCLAVGSPATITYSLVITILNRLWVRTKFDQLRAKAQGNTVQERSPKIYSRIRATMYLLQETQQVPLRSSQQRGWLSSLIVTSDNQSWWERLERSLKSTRRGFTASLVAQMMLAATAFLFTVIASFMASLGDPATALQIASGSLWIWLIPIILGWITVGTQYSHQTIGAALEAEPAARALEPPVPSHPTNFVVEEQKGLVVRSGLTPQPHRIQTVVGAFDTPDVKRLELPTWAGAKVGGDEARKGPVYNYSKLFTWWKLASTIHDALDVTLDNIAEGRVCEKIYDPTPASQWDLGAGGANLSGDSKCTARYCGLDSQSISAYPKWSEMPAEVYRRIIAAAFAAIFLQWGTTGASILIAYKTPTVGMGCRSASYTFYGALGTVTWLCLLTSMLLSHEVMLRYQDLHIKNPSMDFRLRRDPSKPNDPNQYTRTWTHSAFCAGAIITRYLGKTLSIINTVWLVLSSLLEFIGGYQNCWCKAVAFEYGHRGYVVLFKDAADLAAAASLPWGGGLAMTLLVCLASYIFFALGSVKSDDD